MTKKKMARKRVRHVQYPEYRGTVVGPGVFCKEGKSGRRADPGFTTVDWDKLLPGPGAKKRMSHGNGLLREIADA